MEIFHQFSVQFEVSSTLGDSVSILVIYGKDSSTKEVFHSLISQCIQYICILDTY